MAQYRQLFSDAQRQQAIADALAQKAIQPRTPVQQGRITPQMGFGEGLAQLGEALVARRAGKKASTTLTQAEEARRKAQADALSGLSRPQNYVERPEVQSPYARAQTALEAEVDPNVVKSYMAQQLPEQGAAGSASIQGYQLAKSQGYEGSYLDYKREFEGREANAPSSVQEWQMFNALSPQEQQRYLEMKRSVPVETVNQVPTRILPGGAQDPLSTLESESDARRQIAQSTAQGTADVIPADRRLDAHAKEPRLAAAERRLERVASASEQLGSGGGPIEGRARNLVGTPAAQELEAANAQLINELTALTRVPGVGSQSDLEQRLAQLALPSATQHPEVRGRTIRELRAFIADLDEAIRNVSGGTALPQVQQPQSPEAAPSVNWNDL